MTAGFLEQPPISGPVQELYDKDVADSGYVWNVSRLWAYQPDTVQRLFELMSQAFKPSGLEFRQRGILVTAAASSLGDSYCSLAWGGKLSGESGPAVAAGVLRGTDEGLTAEEKAMASWARKIVKDPNATTSEDLQELRDAGLTDRQILGSWRRQKPSFFSAVTILPGRATTELRHRSNDLSTTVLDDLFERLPILAGFSARRLEQAREYLAYVVRYVAAAQMVDDDRVLVDFLDWLGQVLDARNIPRELLVEGVRSLVPLLDAVSAEAGRIGEAGLSHIGAAP